MFFPQLPDELGKKVVILHKTEYLCDQVYTFLLIWHHQYLDYSICYVTACLYAPDNNSFEKNTHRINAACSKIWSANTQGIPSCNLIIYLSLRRKEGVYWRPRTKWDTWLSHPYFGKISLLSASTCLHPFADVSVLRHYQCSFRTHSATPVA